MEQAIRKEPFKRYLLLGLARACGRRSDFAAAERCIEKRRKSPKTVQISSRRPAGLV
jgi:hypothetical protein